MSFIDDIQGQNTQLYPIVEIDGIWYSTNNVTVDGNYCKPILMNIPSIKESVDVESRKFKISNVSLQFNNFPFDGVRFSDQLSETSLINTEATIYFKSPSTTTIPDDENPLDTDLKEVYKGIIRRISHDDTKVKIELEDLTEQKAHKDLPQAIDRNGVVGYLGDGDSIPDKYKNKPIPMVYGEVDRSPVVVSESFSKYQADSRDIKEFVTTYSGFKNTSNVSIYLDPLQVDIDGEMHHIKRGGQYAEPVAGDNSIQLLPNVLSGIVTGADGAADGFEEVSLICRKIASPKFSIANPKYDDSLINDNFLTPDGGTIDNINAIVDGNQDTNFIALEGLRPSEGYHEDGDEVSNRNERLLLSLNFDVTPNHDTVDGNNKIIGLKINQCSLSGYLGDKVLKVNHHNQLWGARGDLTSISDTYDTTYNMITDPNIPDYHSINQVFGFLPPYGSGGDLVPPNSYNGSTSDIKLHFFLGEGDDLTASSMDMPIVLFSGGFANSLAIQFRIVGSLTYPAGDFFHNPIVGVSGDINEVELLVENESLKLFNNDFYANVEGRIQTYDDHPDHDGIEQYDDDLIENPIDIIYDLVRSELGHDAIDEAEYKEAKDAHLGWKFGFTVNKKINSKKLIEEIAKSTKCFPKFKNDGTFGFNSIKDSYTVTDADGNGDYENAHLIKESEVISYSFKKTKPEQIYKKVTVFYNKDYAQDSHLKTALSEDLGADPYYGIESSADAHLEFESDYIRNKDTADDLATFLSKQYKNDHLLFNLKLPLQYINLEIGDLVKFRDLFQGVKAYGIDYRLIGGVGTEVEGYTYTTTENIWTGFGFEEITTEHTVDSYSQYAYPLFMVTATTKNLDSVSIECMQLHHLSDDSIDSAWYDGTGAGDTEGEFYFPDAAEVVIQATVVDEVVLPEDADQIEAPSGYYYVRQNEYYGHYNYSDLVFHKQNGVLLFDFTLYPILNVGELIKINDENNNPFYYEILQVNQNNEESWLVLYPYDVQNQGVLTPLTAILSEYDGDLLITGASWQEVYPSGDTNLDGGLDILDVVTIINHIQGQTLTGQAFENADINQSGNINILDVVGVVQELIN